MNSVNFAEDKERLEKAIMASLVGDYLPCPVALKLASRLNVEPGMVGDMANNLGKRITNCQLGCFKVEKALHDDIEEKSFSQEVTEGIRKAVVNGRLPCTDAHRLSQEIKVGLRELGDVATKTNIKISHCQLNCFV